MGFGLIKPSFFWTLEAAAGPLGKLPISTFKKLVAKKKVHCDVPHRVWRTSHAGHREAGWAWPCAQAIASRLTR